MQLDDTTIVRERATMSGLHLREQSGEWCLENINGDIVFGPAGIHGINAFLTRMPHCNRAELVKWAERTMGATVSEMKARIERAGNAPPSRRLVEDGLIVSAWNRQMRRKVGFGMLGSRTALQRTAHEILAAVRKNAARSA